MMIDKRSYKDLTMEAKKLGIHFVGKTAKQLVLLINKARAENKAKTEPVVEKKVKPTVENKAKTEPVVEKKVKPTVENKVKTEPVIEGKLKEGKSKVDPLKTKEEFDTIVVSKGKMEIRRYTKEVHGKDFVKSARQFTEGSGYSVKVFNSKDKAIKCPSCGHAFDL